MMKKLIALALCAVMALAMAACGGSSSSTAQKEASSGGNAQIPNPFVECETMEEAAGAAGFSLTVPDTVEGYTGRKIFAVKDEMVQVIYTKDGDGSKDLYIRKGKGNEDISGDYNKYPETDTVSVGDLQVATRGSDGKVSVATWTGGDYSFAVMAGDALTGDAFQEIVAGIQ